MIERQSRQTHAGHTLEPSLAQLDSVGLQYHASVQIAERGFVELLKMDSRSSAVYRGYAQFLIEVR